MKRGSRAFAFLAILSTCVRMTAHHSLSAEFDQGRTTRIEGSVKSLDWTNPHANLFLEVRDKAKGGTVTVWKVQLLRPDKLSTMGWNRESVTPGANLRIQGAPAHDNSQSIRAISVTFTATGKTLEVPFVF